MKKSIYFLAVFFATIFWASSVLAATYYVDNAANGSNNGTSWTNAWASFSAINWGSIQPGDYIYISGGRTSKTYTGTLDIGASGTNGSPVTITVGQSSPHNGKVILSDASSIAGIDTNGNDWVTISGQLGANSTPNMQVRGHSNDEVRISGPTGVIFKYVEVGPNTNDECINVTGNYMGGSNEIAYNVIHDCYDYGILISPPGATPSNDDHLRIHHNEIYNLGHDGIHAAARAGGLTIDHNKIHTADSGSDQNSVYVDGMHLRGFSYLTVAYNTIYDLEGTSDGMYSYIFLEADTSRQSNVAANDMYIYNNLIYETRSPGTGNHVGISYRCTACTSMIDISILNNTLVDLFGWGILFRPYGASDNVSRTVVANNIVYNGHRDRVGSSRRLMGINELNDGIPDIGSFGDSPTPDIIWDNNLVDLYSGGNLQGSWNGTSVDYATFLSSCDCGDNGQTTDPTFVSYMEGGGGNYRFLSNNSVGVDDGSARTEFSDDFNGTPRPQGSRWDIGAYEYASGDNISPFPPFLNP